MNQQFGKVAVLLGGSSAERDISLMSGNAVLQALRSRDVDAHAFDPAQRSLCELRQEGYARVFIALHGRGGEDGTVQGALEMFGIPYTGSGVMASSLCMDKWRTKLVWIAAGVPTPRYAMLDDTTDLGQTARDLGVPLIVKPVNEGSTIGITKVSRGEREELEQAYVLATKHDKLVLAEEFISGQELTVAVVGEQVLPAIRIEAPQGSYDYQAKYFSDETRYFCPSGLPADKEREIQELSLHAFRLLGCRGWGRVDLILDGKGRPWFLEMNTSPGMTGHSLVPMAARAAGMSFEDLVLRILGLARLG